MDEPTIRFPVTCPECGKEALLSRSLARIAGILLTRNQQLTLTAPCCERCWIATTDEMEQIREYMSVALASGLDDLDSRDNPR